MPHSPDLMEWMDELPSVFDLDGRGGKPGCEYLYCDVAHAREAEQAGWKQRGQIFQLTGPTGSCPFVFMERGEPTLGLNPERASQPLNISQYLCDATGLGPVNEKLEVVDPTVVPVVAPLPPSKSSLPAVEAVG